MITWIEVDSGNWQGRPSPHRFDAPVIDVWRCEDGTWFCNVQQFSWDDSLDVTKRLAEKIYDRWIDTHLVDRAVAKERASVVAYLLAPGTSSDNATLAAAIERGEHLKERT